MAAGPRAHPGLVSLPATHGGRDLRPDGSFPPCTHPESCGRREHLRTGSSRQRPIASAALGSGCRSSSSRQHRRTTGLNGTDPRQVHRRSPMEARDRGWPELPGRSPARARSARRSRRYQPDRINPWVQTAASPGLEPTEYGFWAEVRNGGLQPFERCSALLGRTQLERGLSLNVRLTASPDRRACPTAEHALCLGDPDGAGAPTVRHLRELSVRGRGSFATAASRVSARSRLHVPENWVWFGGRGQHVGKRVASHDGARKAVARGREAVLPDPLRPLSALRWSCGRRAAGAPVSSAGPRLWPG